jgi:hypothetical protein
MYKSYYSTIYTQSNTFPLYQNTSICTYLLSMVYLLANISYTL